MGIDTAPHDRHAPSTAAIRARPLFDPPIVKRALVDSFLKLDPRTLMEEPGHLRGRDRLGRRHGPDRRGHRERAARSRSTRRSRLGLWFTVLFANFAEAMAEGRGKAQADALRRTRADLVARRLSADGSEETIPRRGAPGRRPRHGRGRRADPRRRRDRRGHRVGRRVGDHRRVGPRDPRVRRRPLGGHRRDEGALGLDQGPDHRRAGTVVHRPDDRPRRGRRATEDPERDRAVDPAGEVHDHLPDRLRRAAAVRDLRGRSTSPTPS